MSSVEHTSARLAADLRAVAERRDRRAFARLFAHFAPRVKAYLRRLGLDDQQAEELAQEVMLTVWERAGQFDPRRATPATWIFAIARNKRIDAFRRAPRAEFRPEEEAREIAREEPEFAEREIALLRRQLERAIEELPPEQAEVLRIYYLEGRSHGEIADALGLPLGTVKSRIRLALDKLRERLGEKAS